MDRLATRTDPLLRPESSVYDNSGNLTQFTDRKSQVTNYAYDALNRRTGVTYADTSTTTYTYDAGNRLTQIVDSISGTITRTYDDLNRLTSETTPQGSVNYTYDAAGRRLTMTVAGQPTTNYVYDDMNRLTQITQGTSVVSFGYDAASRRTSLTLPNGILVQYDYDAASRVTSITYKNGSTVLGDLIYGYDSAGNRTAVGGSWARTGIPDAVNTMNYNGANHQLTFDDKTLTYDNNGNLTSITDASEPSGPTLYTWNARNQLAAISGPGVNASFVYDGLGRREKKTINGNLTEFFYDGGNPVQESSSGSTILANILTGPGIDEYISRTDVLAGTTSSVLSDALGSTLALADFTGTVQTEYTFEPFGQVTVIGALDTNSYQYTGRENDGSGLYYYRNRYYHAQLQRFISEDPIEFDGGDVNLYAYVANMPLSYTDPYGLCFPTGNGNECIPMPPRRSPEKSKSGDTKPPSDSKPPFKKCPNSPYNPCFYNPTPPPCLNCSSLPCSATPYICYVDGWQKTAGTPPVKKGPGPFVPTPDNVE
jgi:RHS repeat-associated protein